MLVFRCECEQVLGVDDEKSKGGLGECPTCGRIIRVPLGLVNAAGKLRVAGPPVRATSTSGSFKQIKEMPQPINGKAAPNGTSKSSGVKLTPDVEPAKPAEPAAPVAKVEPPPVPVAPDVVASSPSNAESPEASNPIALPPQVGTTADAPTEANLKTMSPDEATATIASASAASAESTMTARAVVPGRKDMKTVGKKPTKNQKFTPAKIDANDPNAALETKNDRNIAAVANAAASKRNKAEAAEPAPAKKNYIVIYMIVVVAILIVAGVLYFTGVLNGDAINQMISPSGSPAPVMKKETKPVATPETKAAPAPDVKADPAKPAVPAPDNKPEEKKDEKKDPAAETKPEEKKDPAAETKTDDKK